MKHFILFMIACSFAASASSGPSPCLTKIFENQKWHALSGDELECFSRRPGVDESISRLCSHDKRGLSENYDAYMRYKAEHDKNVAEFQKATDPGQRMLFYKCFSFRTRNG